MARENQRERWVDMAKVFSSVPDSPRGAFWKAVESLTDILGDQALTLRDIADGFVEVLDLLECVAVEQPIYAAARAVLVADFRAICRELLDGNTGMGVRRGAAKDIDLQGKKVVRHAWS